MAVYKSTYCSPLLENIDPRVVAMVPGEKQSCVWLKCKINTSNKNVTGYKIRILDMDNNVVFPVASVLHDEYISPVQELPKFESDPSINSGQNGTMLYIPFFQNFSEGDTSTALNTRLTQSYNAIYYLPRYTAEHLLQYPEYYGWTYTDQQWSKEDWDSELNGDPVYAGEIVFVVFSSTNHNGLYIIGEDGKLSPYKDFDGVPLIEDNNTGYTRIQYTEAAHPGTILIKHGNVHNNVCYWSDTDQIWYIESATGKRLWTDFEEETHPEFDLENGQYKWEITLYQGKGQLHNNDGVLYITYGMLEYDWYDMLLTQGTVLGSTNKRIQIADQIDSGNIPGGKDNQTLVLQNRYVQLIDNQGQQIANRSYVRSYDASFGHVYPTEGDFQLNWIEQAEKVRFYKHANNEEAILAQDKVRLATTLNINLYEKVYSDLEDQAHSVVAANNGNCFKCIQTNYSSLDSYFYGSVNPTHVADYPYGSTRDVVRFSITQAFTLANLHTWEEVVVRAYCYEGFPTSITASNITGITDITGGGEADSSTITTSLVDNNQCLEIHFKMQSHGTVHITATVNVEISDFTMKYYSQEPGALNSSLGLIPVDGYETQNNDRILVKNQSNAQENGVYIAHAGAWERDGGFTQWGNFIGKILFIKEGVANAGTNWESLATGNGNLYNVNSATSGNTPLYFKPETPIVLFGDKVKYGVQLLGDLQITGSGSSVTTSVINLDGVPIALGYQIYDYTQNKIYSVDAVSETSITLSMKEYVVAIDNYLSVELGKVYGNSVVKIETIGTLPNITTDLSEAYILKNSTSKTYVSPFVGAQAGMAIKFLNNKYITMSDNTTTRWLKINKIDTQLWCIEHATLKEPLKSASEVDESVPYKYELRSYFQRGDENPIYCYESPYLKLKINDENIAFTRYDPYQVIDPLLLESVDYLVNEGTYSVIIPGVQRVNNRFVQFTGIYQQFQQISWESYRWILLNKNGDIIQDTGLRYDKEMSVTFYGLEDGEQYAAMLYVVDEVNNQLTLTVYFGVEFGELPSLSGMTLDASFECSTHSVLLSFYGYSYIAPYFVNPDYNISYKYIAENYDKFYSPLNWDYSYIITDDILSVYDVAKINNDYVVITVPLTDIYVNVGTDEYTGLSDSSIYGINYGQLFTYGENAANITADNQLSVDVESENKFYFETQIKLSENYCGKFLSIDIGSANIELGLPDNFTDESNPSRANYNSDADKVYVKVNNSSMAYLYKNASNYFTNFTLTNGDSDRRFVLQRKVGKLPDEDTAQYAYDAFIKPQPESERTLSLWYKKSIVNNQPVYLNSPYDLGNTCLVVTGAESEHPGPMYWAENRGTLVYLANSVQTQYSENPNQQGDGINLTRSIVTEGTNISDPEYIPSWPIESQEDNRIWNEEGINDQPASWDAFNTIGTSQQTLWEYIVRPRHPDSLLSQKFWTLTIECNNVSALQLAESITSAGDSTENTTVITSNGTQILKIRLIPDEEGGN